MHGKEKKKRKTHTPIKDKHPDNTDPAALHPGSATPTEATHMAPPTTCMNVTASKGTKGKAARVPSAFAMARLWRDGVGEKGRRAWPPRRSSKERIVARRWERRGRDMVGVSVGVVVVWFGVVDGCL